MVCLLPSPDVSKTSLNPKPETADWQLGKIDRSGSQEQEHRILRDELLYVTVRENEVLRV